MTEQPDVHAPALLELVIQALRQDDNVSLAESLKESSAEQLALLLESLPPERRVKTWLHVDPALHAETLELLHEEVRASVLTAMDSDAISAAAPDMKDGALADVIEDLGEYDVARILDSLEADHRARLEAALAYPEDTAGRLMTSEVVSVRADVSLAVVLRYLHRFNNFPAHTDAVMVTDDDGKFLGRLAINDVITGDANALVDDVMQRDDDYVPVSASDDEVAQLFRQQNLVSLAVVSPTGELLGRITIDDVLDLIQQEADQTFLAQAGLDEDEDLFAPVVLSARRRGVWLGINLATVFMASAVIKQFEAVLNQVVALAILMPIVASMGGIAGSQTLTLTIRAIALGQLAKANVRWLLAKEIAVGTLNGLVWAVVVAAVSILWLQDYLLGGVIGVAMVINLVVAAGCGVLVPMALRALGQDPALSGAVVLTTVTDIVGFVSFLGLATLVML